MTENKNKVRYELTHVKGKTLQFKRYDGDHLRDVYEFSSTSNAIKAIALNVLMSTKQDQLKMDIPLECKWDAEVSRVKTLQARLKSFIAAFNHEHGFAA